MENNVYRVSVGDLEAIVTYLPNQLRYLVTLYDREAQGIVGARSFDSGTGGMERAIAYADQCVKG